MRILTLLGAILFASGPVLAQKSKIASAIIRYRDNNELKEAAEAIDAAVVHESTAQNPKAWFHRGEIYMRIILTGEMMGIKDSLAIDKAFESYKNAIKYDEKGKYTKDAKEGLENCRRTYFNNGAKAYQAKEYEAAYASFTNSVAISDQLELVDTHAIYFGAQAAYNLEKYQDAIPLLQRATEKKLYGGDAYFMLAICHDARKDSVSQLKALNEGTAAYPDHKDLMIAELNYYLTRNMTDEAKARLQKAIEQEPENAALYFNLGIVNDNMKDRAEAEKAYKKAIQIKPDYTDAIYNLGAMYFNFANEMIQAAQGKGVKEEDKARADANVEFKKAMTYFERAEKLTPDDQNLLFSLKQVYIRLNMKDKEAAINAKIDK